MAMSKIEKEKTASGSCPENHGGSARVGRLLLENTHGIPRRTFLLASCLTMVGACCQKIQGQIVPDGIFGAAKRNPIESNLLSLGIDGNYEIVLAGAPTVVEHTAADMLQKFLGKGGLTIRIVSESKSTGKKRFLLGQEPALKAITRFGDCGGLKIGGAAESGDGFRLKRIGQDIVIAGANARSVLYGVCALEDLVKKGRVENLDIHRVPRVALRFELLPRFLTTDYPLPYQEFTEKTAAYLARLNVNGCIDGGGESWDLSRFVSSDVFPFQKPPDVELRRRISRASSLCGKYGIDYYIMLWEPVLARIDADLDKYPPEALGTVKRPWGGGEGGMDRTLCVSSPIVQQHYRNMVGKFVLEFPDVKGFFFYNLDGNAWLCTPELCPRCKLVCTDSPPDTPYPWETEALFTDLLARAARGVRSDFKFIHWVSHFRGSAAEKLVRRSQEYTALAYGVRNGDHDIMIADTVTPNGSEFLMLQKVCEEKNIPFYVTYSSDTHETIPNGFQLPFAISHAMMKLHAWGVKSIIGSGPIPCFNQINALAEKEFEWKPNQGPEAYLAGLAARQFGDDAGRLMNQAWKEIKDGMDVWRDVSKHPFRGSETDTSLGFSYFTSAKAILPDITEYYDKTSQVLGNAEASSAAEDKRVKMNRLKFHEMGAHLAKASIFARKACEIASASELIGIAYYDGDSAPTMKEYAELNYAPIVIANIYCRLRCNMFSAIILLKKMKNDNTGQIDGEILKYRNQYHDLIREDIGVRKHFVELLAGFSRMHPCLLRTSLSEKGIAYEIAYMNVEREKMEDYLNQIKAGDNRAITT